MSSVRQVLLKFAVLSFAEHNPAKGEDVLCFNSKQLLSLSEQFSNYNLLHENTKRHPPDFHSSCPHQVSLNRTSPFFFCVCSYLVDNFSFFLSFFHCCYNLYRAVFLPPTKYEKYRCRFLGWAFGRMHKYNVMNDAPKWASAL